MNPAHANHKTPRVAPNDTPPDQATWDPPPVKCLKNQTVPDWLLDLGFSATIAERLAKKLVRADSGCLEWTGARYRFGYGCIARGPHDAGNESAHRVAWMLHNGPIPDGMYICHHCDNPSCCEPEHLYLGDALSNTDDIRRRERFVAYRGETHTRCRITDAQVAQMRAEYPRVGSYTEIAHMYGIDISYARALILGIRRPNS